MDQNLLKRLRQLCGAHNVLSGDSLAQRSNGFWDGTPTRALALLTPESTAQVCDLVRCCHDHRQPLVIQGGQTGPVRGQLAQHGEIALSLEKMTAINGFDAIGKTLDVEAGCTLEQVQHYARERELLFPVDIGARGSCTIGGNIATNAGGMEVLRYGMMRNHILGLEAVMADGTLLSAMNRMQKNNTGYDLKQLLIGSEGTLAIVTRAVLQLRPLPDSCETALIACRSLEHVMASLDSAQRTLGDVLTRFEVMDGNYYALQTGPGGFPAPLAAGYPWYVLVETMGFNPHQDKQLFEEWLARLVDRGEAGDIVMAHNQRQREGLWRIREDFEVRLGGDLFFLYDVSLPIPAMPDYLAGLRRAVSDMWPGALFFALGHMADGNLHFFLAPGQSGDRDVLKERADELVYGPLRDLGGSVSAEHGIGIDKRHWLGHSRSAAEIALMKAVKQLMDPHNLLNPGRVLIP